MKRFFEKLEVCWIILTRNIDKFDKPEDMSSRFYLNDTSYNKHAYIWKQIASARKEQSIRYRKLLNKLYYKKREVKK